MNKKISATTYSTIALVGIAACIGIVSSGWESIWSLIYFILGMFVFSAMIIFLTKLLPDVWVLVLVAIAFIIFIHINIQSWLFTMIISCLAIILLFIQFKLHQKFLSIVLFLIMIALYFYVTEFDGFQQAVHVTDTDIQNVVNEVQVNSDVVSVNLRVGDDMVFCTLEVEDGLTIEEGKTLGEECGSVFAQEVSADHLDLFYKNYKLTLMVKIGQKEEILSGKSSLNDGEIIWSKVE